MRAHPLDHAPAALAFHDLDATCEHLGPDGARWRTTMEPLLRHSTGVVDLILSGQRGIPRDLLAPFVLAPRVLTHGSPFARTVFRTERARSLLTGVAAHAVGKLPSLASGAVALLLGHLAHGTGWPIPQGGSIRIAQAMADDIKAHGGVIHTGRRITDLRELGHAETVLLDVSPKTLLEIAGDELPERYMRRLARFRYGPAAAKVDFLVSDPIPWTDPHVGRAGTVHLGGTQREMFRQENTTAKGIATGEPFVLVVDPMTVDPGRGLPRKRPVWAYAHVPNGDTRDPVDIVRARIERYAPGFTDTVLAQRSITAAAYEAYNPNYVGGDIGSGAMTLTQSILRPAPQLDPYPTPLPGICLCSASTPPGSSVHGMSGYLAALSVLRREYGIRTQPSLTPNEHLLAGC